MVQSRFKFLNKPNQARTLSFPKCSFGKKHVVEFAFKVTWLDRWNWIHYDEVADAAFCHICSTASKDGKLEAASKDYAFIQRGFSNWKDAMEGFRRHEHSKCHQDVVQVIITLPKYTQDIGESLSTAHMRNKADARRVFIKILQNVKFLERQGITFRGMRMRRAISCSCLSCVSWIIWFEFMVEEKW